MRDMRNKFVLLAEQSSGSNMLKSALDNHPDITVMGELFLRLDQYNNAVEIPEIVQILGNIPFYYRYEYIRYRYPFSYIERAAKTRPGGKHFGFKLMLKQNDALAELIISSNEWKKIFLYRNNLLAAFASRKHAHLSGIGNMLKYQQEIPSIKIKFDEDEFNKFIATRYKRRNNLYAMMDRYTASYLSISYSEIATVEGLNKVLDFLGIQTDNLPGASTKKRSSNDIVNRFSNPDAVKKYLSILGKQQWSVEMANEY